MAKGNKTELIIEGMDCTNCALGISKQLDAMGLQEVNVNFATAEVSFVSADGNAKDRAVEKITAMGYKVVADVSAGEMPSVARMSSIEKKFWLSLFLTVPLLLSMVLPWDLLHQPWLHFALALPVFITGLFHFGRSAWFSLRSGVPNMDVLIITGSSAAFIYSMVGLISNLGHAYMFFETSASIITLIFLGNVLEHRAVKQTTSAIDELVRLQTSNARLVITINGMETLRETETRLVKNDDVLLVNSGEVIPADGVIVWGEGTVDESPVTGESDHVLKLAGDAVVGSTVLTSGSVRVRATAVGKDSVLGRIIELVKNAQADKPRLQSLADKISAVFVPVVTGIAVLTFVFSWLVFHLEFSASLMRGVAVLVIACPCALGLAIPTAVVVGVGRVSRLGILIRGASAIQKLTSVKHIAFDKTGTLTSGEFSIRSFEFFDPDETAVKSALCALEFHSSHPLAVSLLKELEGQKKMEFASVTEEKGVGVSGTDMQGNLWKAGSYRMLPAKYQGPADGIFVIRNEVPVARIVLEDEIREGAAEVISFFKSRGIVPVMISGDKSERCHGIAAALGIEKVYPEQMPAAKLEIIRQLSRNGGVAMVGDGINDAPALAGADIGISLSNATQAAINSAQVVLLNGNLKLIPPAYLISSKTLAVIKQNLFWAFFYNVIAIPVAAAGMLSPMIAAASMAVSDVVVVLNSLRLRKKKLN